MRFSSTLEGLIVLKWHEMLWQLVPQSCCTNRKTPVTISTSGSVDMQLFAACGTVLNEELILIVNITGLVHRRR
jgi:hypothetical protein